MSESEQTPAPAETPARGRPSEYTPELAREICEALAEGISLREVCKREG